MKLVVTRDVPISECDWLKEDIKAGTIVYKFYDATYGCIGMNGTAVTFNENGDYPFFELPWDSVQPARIEDL